MEIYLDTGNIEEIREIAKTGLISGVTTNPSLISKENKNFEESLKDISKILSENLTNFTLSAEVTELDSAETMIKQAKKLIKIDKNIIIKIPLTQEGLIAVKELSKKRIKCNVTLCFSSNQALLAAKAGAWCVSPFIGRIEDIGYDGVKLIREIREIFDKYNFKTKILSASIRNTRQVKEISLIGTDIATIPYKVFKQMYKNPLTDIGIKKFNEDWQKYLERNLF